MRKPKSSRLSLQTTLNRVTEERDAFQQALEDIADILEDVGMLEPQEPYLDDLGEHDGDEAPEQPEETEPEVIDGTAEKVEER